MPRRMRMYPGRATSSGTSFAQSGKNANLTYVPSSGTCDITAVSSSASDVQTAINAATNGQRVCLPASSNATWTSAVTLSSSKYITLDLNGNTITLSGASGSITIQSNATGLNRITNGTIIKSGTGYSDYQGPISVQDTASGYGVRLDHITFSGTGLDLANGVYMDINGQGAGLIDHCTFTGMTWAQEFIHINGWGAGDSTGWTTSVSQGSGSLFYFEDCTFRSTTGQLGVAWIQCYYGSRVVMRYCTLDQVSFDAHGTPGNIGTRWWEIYNNVSQNTVSGSNMHYLASLRAGSGVVFNNTVSGSGSGDIGLCEEDSGYPALYQIGRGTSQALDPAYVWNNDGTVEIDGCDAPEVPGMVQVNRDVYLTTKSGYSAYTYPHPWAT